MSGESVFLRPDVIIEPLVDRFYAWLHTVSPVQAAVNLVFVQIPLLESYMPFPQARINASRDPALRDGIFINIEASRSEEACELLTSIKRDRAQMLALAAAVVDAEDRATECDGFDLTPLYPELPRILSGLVELAYDTNNHPLMRYLEPLANESGRRIHGVMCRPWRQVGSSFRTARMALVDPALLTSQETGSCSGRPGRARQKGTRIVADMRN